MNEKIHRQAEDSQKDIFDDLLEVLPLSDHVIWGHGTLASSVGDKILVEGIDSNPGYDLFNIATPLSSNELTASENISHILKESYEWKHKNAKFIVLLAVPFGIRPNNVVERIEKEGKDRTHLPSRFIIGYIDAQNKTFIQNPNFIANANPTEGLIKPVALKVTSQLERPAPNVSVQSEDGDIDDVW